MLKIVMSNLFILGIFTYMGYKLMPLRSNKHNLNFIKFIISFVLINFTNINGPSLLGLIGLIFIHFIYFFIMFRGKLSNSLLVLVPFPLIIIASEFLVGNILNYTINIQPNLSIDSNMYLFAIFLSDLLIFLLLIPYIKLSKLFMDKTLPWFTWLVFILPFSTLLFFFNIYKTHFYLLKLNNLLFISIIGILVSNFVFLYFFYKAIISIQDKNDMMNAQNREKYLSDKIELIEEHYNNNFTFLHDLLHKCKLFKEHIEVENYIDLKNEVNNLFDVTFKEFNLLYTNSPFVYSLVKDKIEMITKSHIHLKTTIEYNDFSFISLDELNVLLSIIFEKAISENLNVPTENRSIIFKSMKEEMQIIFHITYSSNDGTTFSKNDYRSLNNILSKYNAMISEHYETSHKVMSVIINFPC